MDGAPEIDDGGPAFPQPMFVGPNGQLDYPWNGWGMGGLSLRDWLAGQAFDANMREAVEWYNAGNACDVYQRAATGSYRAADAMLAARKAGGAS